MKTLYEAGIILYAADGKRDFIALYMARGKIMFSFHTGGGAATIESKKNFNDGLWHTVRVISSYVLFRLFQNLALFRGILKIWHCLGTF